CGWRDKTSSQSTAVEEYFPHSTSCNNREPSCRKIRDFICATFSDPEETKRWQFRTVRPPSARNRLHKIHLDKPFRISFHRKSASPHKGHANKGFPTRPLRPPSACSLQNDLTLLHHRRDPLANNRRDLQLPPQQTPDLFQGNHMGWTKVLATADIFRFLRTCSQPRSSISPRLRASSSHRIAPESPSMRPTQVAGHLHSLQPRRRHSHYLQPVRRQAPRPATRQQGAYSSQFDGKEKDKGKAREPLKRMVETAVYYRQQVAERMYTPLGFLVWRETDVFVGRSGR
ncbi:hypothetical protein JMJ78_0000891, partial [Colletotrichum scovillei]